MKITLKRIVSFALLFAMLLSLLPATFAAKIEQPEAIAQRAYDDLDADIWNAIVALEKTELPAVRGKAPKAAAYAALADDIIALVEASDTYKKGTLINKNGFLTWETTGGVTCGYSPALRARARESALSPSAAEIEAASGVGTVSYAARGTTSSVNVSVFQPYYGLDSSFTTQYVNEGKAVAEVMGGTCTTYRVNNATIDNLADAMETSGVVFFDSHGDTDYYNEYNESDYTSKANTSYICLQSGTGLTAEDQKPVSGTYGTYYHAYYAGYQGSTRFYCVDGTAIANHMEKKAPNSLLWMAICLGMATDGLYAPLREKGVGVVYGYSQSVTFDYDYAWEAVFFRELKKGANVSDAIGTMKSEIGKWDCCEDYTTIASARRNYCAFPIVASEEDAYPGKGKVDALQTVYSTWTLPLGGISYTVTAASNDETLGTVSVVGNLVTATASEGAQISGWTLTPENAATVTQEGENTFRLSNVTADCCLTVNFAAKPCATVHYSVPNGCTKTDSLGYVGEKITLSKPEGSPTADAQNYSFVGWAEAPLEDTTNKPVYYKASYTPTKAETTLYALYQYHSNDLKTYYTTNLQNKTHYTISAASNDETLGTVTLEDAVVTANAKEGAYIAGFILTPANAATVTRADNRFILSDVTEDCLLTVNFAAKLRATVHYSVPDGCTKTDSLGYVGEGLALTPPEGSPTADAQSYRFVGWMLAPVQDSKAAPEYLTDTFTPTKAETTLYALYSYEAGNARYYTTRLQNHICYLKGFTDTKADAWYHEAVDFAVGNGYMKGMTTDSFAPNGKLTRAMLATILYRKSGETGGSHPFTDVKTGAWYDEAIAWAYASGVVNGIDATTFRPDAYVTREQAAAMLYRYAAHMGEDTTAMGDLSAFRDAGKCSAYAIVPLRWAVGNRILNGKGGGVLDPTGTATRAEIAQILLNLAS